MRHTEDMKKKAEEAIQLKKGGKNSDEKKEDSSKEEVKEEPAAAADNRIVPEGVIPDEALEGAKKQDVPPAPEEPGKTKRKLKLIFKFKAFLKNSSYLIEYQIAQDFYKVAQMQDS